MEKPILNGSKATVVLEGNEKANRLAAKGATMDPIASNGVLIPCDFELTGIKLVTASQALLHKGIRETKTTKTRRATSENLEITCEATLDLSGKKPTNVTQ
jgi:ribonuclease HI